MVSAIEEIKNCPACGSENLVHVTSRDQVVCKDCGMMHEPFSSVAEEVLEITHPSEETEISKEKIKAVLPKPKVREVKKKAKKRSKKKTKKKKPRPKKKIKKKAKSKKKPKKKPKPRKKLKKGLKSRLRRLVKRKKK